MDSKKHPTNVADEASDSEDEISIAESFKGSTSDRAATGAALHRPSLPKETVGDDATNKRCNHISCECDRPGVAGAAVPVVVSFVDPEAPSGAAVSKPRAFFKKIFADRGRKNDTLRRRLLEDFSKSVASVKHAAAALSETEPFESQTEAIRDLFEFLQYVVAYPFARCHPTATELRTRQRKA
ncbi:uncharacterized protein LOC132701087 [Cylas formicarius]|uniref:uncharacterized protein LOC132701087 n=1 Tax=Cylas formicarius TaxID=197179 RepID=UPI002958DB41|nr:uncharacterized protein LOC132701087 [Cylas formicarius]